MLDKELTQTPAQKKLAARKRAYYEANKDKLAAQRRARRSAGIKIPQRGGGPAGAGKRGAYHENGGIIPR